MSGEPFYVSQRVTAPQPERFLIEFASGRVVTALLRARRTGRQVPEEQQVQLIARKPQSVGAVRRIEHGVAVGRVISRLQDLAEPAHMRLYQADGSARRLLSP